MLGERHLDLLTGAAQFTEDLVPADSLRAVLLRAPVGHGRITALDLSAARAAPGVRAVYDAGDLAAGGVKPMRSRAPVTGDDGQPMREPERPVLATDSVKYLGQPIAVVIADSQAAAEDARDLIDLGIDEAPVINSAEAAAAEDATQLWPMAPGNQSFIWRAGTPAVVETAMADAAHVVTLTVRHPRRAISPVENRSCVGCYDPTSGRF
ncbi:MAG: xanthine dehydrogenase family protein, partial [Pseudomonadota bacterium]|nr:xanthine dehydrogenase family protein [Pseudomonadota bacterium]